MAKTRGIDRPRPEPLNLPNRRSNNFVFDQYAVLRATSGETTDPHIFLLWDNDDYFLYSCGADAWYGDDMQIGDTGFSVANNTVMEYDLSAKKIYFGNWFDEWHVKDFDLSDNYLHPGLNSSALTAPGSLETGWSWARAVHPDTTRDVGALDDDTIFWCDGDSELREYSIAGDSWTTRTDVPKGMSRLFWLPDVDPTKLFFVTQGVSSANYFAIYQYDIAGATYDGQVGSDFYVGDLSNYESHWCDDGQYIYFTSKGETGDLAYYGGSYLPVFRVDITQGSPGTVAVRSETWLPTQPDSSDTAYPWLHYGETGARLECVTIGSTKYLYWFDLPNVTTDTTLVPKFWRIELI